MALTYSFKARLWHYPEEAGWYFLTLPEELAAEIREDTAPFRRGFGSVKVTATVSGQGWSTSLFPDSKSSSYLLPVKKAIRVAAGIDVGDQVDVRFEVAGAA
ncbi:DUF1905 domain-containing protein [Arthrobacter cavernae]|uniref:DUF1905 domain-containing protein n=1 Tax=Arthrobacter cavernae TaxID=2817681 RepID=A0A939HL21_9MICC|nr:DUF1905 domain-containing protein [Arthrobacter cavernae]MBO1269273.1 DUF1905 domain-containing protein [Arthrobacter cavernae]